MLNTPILRFARKRGFFNKRCLSGLSSNLFFYVISTLLALFFILMALTSFCDISHAQGHLEPIKVVSIEGYTVKQWVNAIFLAEGGENAQYPYGIRSIKCSTKESCREICFNTVKNNFRRWKNSPNKGNYTFLQYLSRRYAPEGVRNDPKGLNYNWQTNVNYFLRKG